MPHIPVPTTGVYCIQNRKNKKLYVGSSSVSSIGRINGHRKQLKKNLHHNRYLQFAWNKYGAKTFVFKILERCCPDDCLKREQHWMDYFQSAKSEYGYNLYPTAGSPKGTIVSDSTKAKFKVINKKRWKDPEYKAKMVAIHKERTSEGDGKEAMMRMNREAMKKLKGKVLTVEAKQHISVRVRKQMDNPELRAQMRISSKKRWDRHRARLLAIDPLHYEKRKPKVLRIHKLTLEDVAKIKKLYTWWNGDYNAYKLAEMFDVTQTCVMNILKGRIPRHLLAPPKKKEPI